MSRLYYYMPLVEIVTELNTETGSRMSQSELRITATRIEPIRIGNAPQ